MMNDQYDELKKKIPELTIERHQVSFQSKTKQEHFLLSVNIYNPLHHLSEGKWTLPLWQEFCWGLFLEGDSGYVEKNSNTINENLTPAEKNLFTAICQRILAGNEKKETDGKTMDHEKKKTPIPNKEKDQNKVLPGKIKQKNKKMMERKRTARTMNYLKKNNFMRPLEKQKRRECMTAKMKSR